MFSQSKRFAPKHSMDDVTRLVDATILNMESVCFNVGNSFKAVMCGRTQYHVIVVRCIVRVCCLIIALPHISSLQFKSGRIAANLMGIRLIEKSNGCW